MAGKRITGFLIRKAGLYFFRSLIRGLGAPVLLTGAVILFILLAVYGALPVAGGTPYSLKDSVKQKYMQAAADVNPPVISCYKFEKAYLLSWGLLYALDFFGAQVREQDHLPFTAVNTGKILAPRFYYRDSTITVVSKSGEGTAQKVTPVKLLVMADTFEGTYTFIYRWEVKKESLPGGTEVFSCREVPVKINYRADWSRFTAVLEKVAGRGAATGEDRLMVLAAAGAFAQGRQNIGWLGTSGRAGVSAGKDEVPYAYLPYFRAAGQKYGIDWSVLAAIAEIESDFNPFAVGPPNYTGELAQGMMQILPSTWRMYKVKAYGTGPPSPFNPADSIFTAAHILFADGAPSHLRRAIYLYNHSQLYVEEVLSLAKRLQEEDYPVATFSQEGG